MGTIENFFTASDIAEMEAKFGIFDFPFLFADRSHVYHVSDGMLGDELNRNLVDSLSVRVIGFGELGFR